MSIYSYSAQNMTGEEKSFEDYRGKVLLIVNTASQCGFTPQFTGLQQLYNTYRNQGFEILGFPCNQFAQQDPDNNEQIAAFCQQNYGVSFQMFQKVDVKGKKQHPLFAFLTETSPGIITKQIKWNFTKFLVDRNGNVRQRFAPQTTPEKMESAITSIIQEKASS